MKKRLFHSTACLILVMGSPASLADDICDALQIAKIAGPATFPATATVTTPDINQLPIQVYTTQLVSDTGDGREHKCQIAHDLWEVDRMLMDVGFDGYTPPTNKPIFTGTGVVQVDSNDIETVRDVAREILNPAGLAEPAIQNLRNNPTLFNDKVLNVYYVHSDDDSAQSGVDFLSSLTGIHIRDEDGYSAKMIFISDSAKSDTVAHEFAHAFSAGHVNFWGFDGTEYCTKFLPHPDTDDPVIDMKCEFSATNYMWAASDADRQDLVDAQKARMMRNKHSIIYWYSPTDEPLECPDFNSNPHDDTPEDDACPRMGL